MNKDTILNEDFYYESKNNIHSITSKIKNSGSKLILEVNKGLILESIEFELTKVETVRLLYFLNLNPNFLVTVCNDYEIKLVHIQYILDTLFVNSIPKEYGKIKEKFSNMINVWKTILTEITLSR